MTGSAMERTGKRSLVVPREQGGRCDPAGMPHDEYASAAGFYGDTENDEEPPPRSAEGEDV